MAHSRVRWKESVRLVVGMTTTAQSTRKMKWKKVFLLSFGMAFLGFVVLSFGSAFECEWPFWPTLWLAEQTRAPDGSRVVDLIRTRSDSSFAKQHWHHCTFCNDVYPHAPHMAVRVTGDINKRDFYLFDWDLWNRRLLPITVRTAKTFPELIPPGSFVKP